MIKKVLLSIALYLTAMILTTSVTWVIGISTKSISEMPKIKEVRRQLDETTDQTTNQTETVASSEATVSPFDFKVNIIREKPLKTNVMYFTEPRYISREILYELKCRKVKICRKPRRWSY